MNIGYMEHVKNNFFNERNMCILMKAENPNDFKKGINAIIEHINNSCFGY
jgi:hypothetical protein